MFTRLARRAGLAAAAFLVSAAAAVAAPAVATDNVNVRSGPGTGHAKVDALQRGQSVEVTQCQGLWCYVEKPGPDGWVLAEYLERGFDGGFDDEPPRYPRPDFPPADGPVVVRPGPGVNRPEGPVVIRPGSGPIVPPGPGDWDDEWPDDDGWSGGDDWDDGPRPRRDRVCFFQREDFGGDSFCARPGEADSLGRRWNDRISSIRIEGDAAVEVCRDPGAYGPCEVFDRSARRLGPYWNDAITSYSVE